jgi:hypothetical protein
MQFKRGDIISAEHERTGTWIGRVVNAFDTETHSRYMIRLNQIDKVVDEVTELEFSMGNLMPSKASLYSSIEKINKEA